MRCGTWHILPMETYRVAPGGTNPGAGEWVVVPVPTDEAPEPAAVAIFGTKELAQAEADRLNAIADTHDS